MFVRDPTGNELCFVATVRHIYQCNIANNGNTWATVEQGLPLQSVTGPPVSLFAPGDATSPLREYVASPIRDLAGSYAPGQYYIMYATVSGAPTSRWDAKTVNPSFAFTGGVYSYYVDAATVAPQWQPVMGTGSQSLDTTVFIGSTSQFAGTPIARYERLATTEQVRIGTNPDPDTVYM
jgi:hypothetical protein